MGFLDTLNVKCINELAIREKRVFIRADYNMPSDNDGCLTEVSRIQRMLPTIKHAIDYNARVIIASHIGNPGCDRSPSLSLEPFAAKLAELLDRDIFFFEDCVGMGAQQMVRDLKPGQVLVLENLRYNEDELKNSSSFARELAKMCDVYINDAFGISHKKEASVHALPAILDTKGMGFQMKKELEELSRFSNLKWGDGFYAIMGGSKASDKIADIRQMLEFADRIFVGGAVAHTFLAADGKKLGNTVIREDKLTAAKETLKRAEVRKIEIVLPVDHIVAESINSTETIVCDNYDFPEGMSAFDIGPETVKLFKEKLEGCKSLFWNGPLGVFESEQFSKGSIGVAKAVTELTAHTVAGGKDTFSLMQKAGVSEKFGFISTGGEAALELIKKNTLPGLDILK